MEEAVRRAMKPSADEIAALPPGTNDALAREFLGGRQGHALDIGCGAGQFTKFLAALFIQVSGVDVSAKAIAKARAGAAAAGLAIDFRIASGLDLPFPAAFFDTVVFSNSLHHMPDIAAALAEAQRVLQPGGLLYVMEPVPAGSFHEGTKLVNDETEVRTAAYRALQRLADHGMEARIERIYRGRRRFADFAAWHEDQIERNPERQKKFDAQPDEVRRRFEASAMREDGGFVFDTVSRVNLLRKKS